MRESKLWTWLRRNRCDDLEVLAAPGERPGARWTGAVTVPLDRIVGTVARCCEFDRCFRPRRPHLRARLDSLRRGMAGRHLPPIRLRQTDHRYFVVDGHHRVALARERGMVAMDAVVTCDCGGTSPDGPGR